MKRYFCILLSVILCVLSFVPVSAAAQAYQLGDTDMTITVDDSIWYVFTRENIQNNAELDELGMTYDAVHDILYNNEAYMDAVLLYEGGQFIELFVRKRVLDTGIANLSNYKDAEVMEFARELAKKQGAEEYSVYQSQYKFANLEYVDSNLGYYVCEFVTFVNKDNYTLTFQSTTPFTDEEYAEIKAIVDSVVFAVDPTIKEGNVTSFLNSVTGRTIGAAVIGGLIGLVIAKTSKKKKKSTEEAEAPATETTEM